MINIYSVGSVIAYLKEKNISPNKSRGQNFLIDENIAKSIASISLKPREKYCVEIGGGLGSLSEKLFDIYKNNLSVVEYDNALYNHLKDKFENKINIKHKDILKTNLVKDNILKENDKFDLYGNIPYNIASKILDWLFVSNYGKWNYAVMMVQKDFAVRIMAKEGSKDYSALTMFTNFMVSTKLEFNVSNKVFYPAPKIQSCVISFLPNEVDINIFPIYKTISKCLFHNRRKMARNNLINSPYSNFSSNDIHQMFEALSIDSNIRGEDISSDIVKEMCYYILKNKLF